VRSTTCAVVPAWPLAVLDLCRPVARQPDQVEMACQPGRFFLRHHAVGGHVAKEFDVVRGGSPVEQRQRPFHPLLVERGLAAAMEHAVERAALLPAVHRDHLRSHGDGLRLQPGRRAGQRIRMAIDTTQVAFVVHVQGQTLWAEGFLLPAPGFRERQIGLTPQLGSPCHSLALI